MTKEVIEVNIETIRELKRRGKHREAQEMINAHQEQVKKGWNEVRTKIRRTDSKIHHHKKKRKGLCYCGRSEPVEGKSKCQSCLDKNNQNQRKKYKENTEKGLCFCGRKPVKGKVSCKKCLERLIKYQKKKKDEKNQNK